MFTNTKIALLCTGLSIGGLSFLDAGPPQQAAHVPNREIFGSYVDNSGNEHEIMLAKGGWSYVDLMVYRNFELVPVKDGEAWKVKIFSAGKRITTTMLFVGEESAVTEAKRIVDRM
jgi:hypothetical protein